MAKVKVKVLQNHTTDRLHVKGSEYLMKSESVDYAVRVGWVEVVPKKKKRNESTDGDNK